VKRAWRRRALETHPDKHPGDKAKAAAFALAQRAWELLRTETGRMEAEGRLRARWLARARELERSAKRRRLADDLEERERAHLRRGDGSAGAAGGAGVRAALSAELEALRERRTGRGSAPGPSSAGPPGGSDAEAGGSAGGRPPPPPEDVARAVKATWLKSSGADYPYARLKAIFSALGEVEDIVVRESKHKGSAVVLLGSSEAARSACQRVCGDARAPLLVVPAPAAALAGAAAPGGRAFEAAVLARLRAARPA